jgi:hypothetical protein
MRDCFLASFLTAQIGSAHQASVWARLMMQEPRPDTKHKTRRERAPVPAKLGLGYQARI